MATSEDIDAAMREHSLADIIHDIGYAFTASVEVCKNHMLNFGARELTTIDVAKTISTMIKYRSGSPDDPQIQMPGNFWISQEKDSIPHGMSEWNADVFVQTLKELAPNLNWKDVVLELDHQQFIVPDRTALNQLFTILRLGFRCAGNARNIFPVEYLYRRWTNMEGQMSLISNILKHPDIFSLADHPFDQVSIDFLKSYSETENKEVGTWRSIRLVELLLYAAEHGFYVLVTELFKLPLQHYPDVLFLVLMQINPPITLMRQELLKILVPIFLLGDHPNSGMILCRAWHSHTLNVKSIIMHAMADWYLRGECDHFRLSRILDISQDLKALSLLLNLQSFPFVIDLACLASRREYLKLDKWLTDKIRDNGESFIVALVQFVQKRYPMILPNNKLELQVPKTTQLPFETITTMLACLQMCIPNVQQELQELIYNVIADYQTLVLNKTRHMRNVETPSEPSGAGAQSLAMHGDPVAMLTPSIGNMSLGARTNTALPNMYDILGSPSKPMSVTRSSSAKMPIQYNTNVTNIGMLGGVTPALPLEKSHIQDAIPYPQVTQNLTKEIEDEANSYFKRIYNHPAHQSLSIDEALDMLKKFQDSPNKRERDVFSYMLQNLFEEYKFFPQYPDKELHTTAQLFGGIIEKGLVPSYVSLGLALGFVLDALKKGEGTKMYYFGIAALDRFKSRLKDYHKYCEHVKTIPYFHKFPRHLIEFVEYGLKSQEPPAKPQGPGLVEAHGPALSSYSEFVPRPIVSTPSSSMVPEMTTTGSASRPSIANVTNINTLLNATEDAEEITTPPEAIQDKTAFIFNNLSQLNLQTKCEELKKIMTDEYFPWLSRYLVMNRVSIEFNFHTLYANLLDVFKVPEMNKLVTRETYRNIKVLLRSDKEIHNFTDRSLLKNFGHWLGLLTLARNLPILVVDIDLKALLLEAYHRSRQDLLYVVPFVAKVLQSCSKSVVFKPPNPWTMALMNVLAELHQEPNLELNLKFEVEVLCKNLNLDVADLKPATYLKDKKILGTIKFRLSSQSVKEQEVAGVKPMIEMKSPQPEKERQEAASTKTAMPVNQVTAPTQMMQPIDLSPTELLHNDPSFLGMLALPEPRFNYHDINVTSTAIGHNIFFNPNIILFQNYPHLKQLVKPAIERSIQEWIHPVVDRAIKYALTTCEQIVRKDFALDPDEMRMRTCAHNMMRNLTAGMAMITCREQITLTISANLKAAFTAALIPATSHQDVIEDAATTLAADNMELACAFIQKTAVEKALPEVDKCLLSDYEIRKLAREEGRRYYDPIELTYQTEMIPERCRTRVGAPTDLQLSVYEEFARKIPGFAPVTDAGLFALKPAQEIHMSPHLTYNPVMTPSQVYGTDEISALVTAAEIYLGSALTAALARNMHSLLECLYLERRNRDIVSRCTLLQKAVEGHLAVAQPATIDLETTRYREIHLRVLKVLEGVYGREWTSKQITCCLAECREEIRYNVEAVDCLIRNGLVNLPQYDIALTHLMDNGNNCTAVAFAMQLLRLYLDDNTIVTESDLHHTKDMLTRVITHSRQLEGLAPLIETVRVDIDPGSIDMKRSVLGHTAHIHSEIMEMKSKNYDDPPGLKEKTENILKDWNNFLHSPLTEINLQRNFNLYIHHTNMNTIFSSNDLTTGFLRISIRMCIENVYEELSKDRMNPSNDPVRREKYYVMCDSFVKLVSMIIKHINVENPAPKLNLLNKVLGIITGCLLRDHEERGTSFRQLPYHRLLLMLLFDMTLEPTLDSINCQVVTSFCHALHLVRPAVAAGFSFSWLEIVSHRVLLDRVLADNPHQKGWGMYSTLLIDLFKFLAPFLHNNELAPPVLTLYKGTLKLLLVLLHDFPEFLCDHHYAFCDVISPNCIQMRNLVLSAFPRNMRMPDPFTPNLKVDLLREISSPPRSVLNYATLLPNSQFKKDLDTYLSARAPVTFLSELRRNMQVVTESVRRYNGQLMNAVVLYVGTQAIASIRARGDVPRMPTIAHSAYMDIFQNISVDFDDEGRYLFLNAIANQLRYPNSHTHYFSCVLLYLFAEANSETIQVQITRMLLERLIVNRPHPWGLLITFIELIKNPAYKFWQREFVNYVPEIEHYEKLPSLYNYIVEKIICKISGRKDHNYDADVDN